MTDIESDTPQGMAGSHWLALQYVLGELNERDAAAFEERLAVDQNARDRVVDAVRLVESVSQSRLGVVQNQPAKSVWNQRRARFAGLALATVVLISLGLFISEFNESTPHNANQARSTPVDTESERLLALWTESGASLPALSESESYDEGTSEGFGSLMPPDWMLAAVEQEMLSAPSFEHPLDGRGSGIERN